MSSSHMRTEKALDLFLQHFQDGNPSAKSRAAVSAVSEESMDVAWPQLLCALEDFDLDQQTANENHLFVVDWLVGAMMDGLLPFGNYEEEENDSSSSSSLSELELFMELDIDEDSESEPDEYPGVLDQYMTRKSTTSSEGPDDILYLKPFGQLGRIVAKEVRSSQSTFRDDVNRAREYWKRGYWEEVKSYLLRILIQAQRPNHRQSDISARTAAFLLGIAYNNSGDLDTAMQIMLSVMTPFDRNEHDSGPSDEGHIAAATWLGDLCLKTNRIESAALAWAMAFDAANTRSKLLSQGNYSPSESSSSVYHHRSASHSSVDSLATSITPAPLQSASRRPTSLSKTFRLARAQAIAILNRLESVNRKIRNLDALTESLLSGWDPDNADHVFSQSRLLSMEQMQRVAKKAREAIDMAVEANSVSTRSTRPSRRSSRDTLTRPSPRSSRDTLRRDAKPLPSPPPRPPPRRSIAVLPGGRAATEEILSILTPAEDVLQTPVRSSEWPLAYDVKFSRSAAIKTINWVHTFTPLDLEDVMSDVPTLDVKQYRTTTSAGPTAKPTFIAEKLDTRKPDDGAKFLAALQRMLDALGFEHLEEPSLLRCRPKTDRSSKWPSVACFALNVIKYKPDGFKRAPKFAVYVSNVMHWSGQMEGATLDHAQTKVMLDEMAATLHSQESEEKDIWVATAVKATFSRPQNSSRSPVGLTQTFMSSAAPPAKKITISGPKAITISGPLNPKAIESPW